jgi:hypothetical protein
VAAGTSARRDDLDLDEPVVRECGGDDRRGGHGPTAER